MENSEKKYLIFIDVDGTLLPVSTKQMSDEIANEILRIRALGHIPIISTGRAMCNVNSISNIHVFEYISTLMGSMIFKMPNEQVLHTSPSMKKDDLLALVETLDKNKHPWLFKNKNQQSLSQNEEFLEKFHAENVTREDFERELENENIFALLVGGHVPERIRDEFPNFNFYSMVKHGYDYTDVSKAGNTKASCVEYFKKQFPNFTTVSIGDGFNDLEMFKATEISIAMGNASEKIKKETTYTTKSLDENGVIYAFRNILKI